MYCSFFNEGLDVFVGEHEVEVRMLFDGFYVPFYLPLEEFKKTIIEKYGQFTGVEIKNELDDFLQNTIEQN